MSDLRRIVLVRHGETEGASSVRFHGRADVALSAEGREQARAVAAALDGQHFDLLAASPLKRAWKTAWIAGRGAPVTLLDDLREIDFGRWEGLTKQEIEARDPVGYADWQGGAEGFEFPGGELRADFRARVEQGLETIRSSGARSALVVAHKGVIRTLAAALGVDLSGDGELPLGGLVVLTRDADGGWFRGQRSSDPADLGAAPGPVTWQPAGAGS